MTPKTFILGIGAQRSGSTWLHSQIRKNKQINMGFRKEYHVFDILFTPYMNNYRSKIIKRVQCQNNQLKANNDPSIEKDKKLLTFLEDPENYFDYFDKLYQQNEFTEAVGDITPSYSMLDANAFEFIRHGLEKRGFHIKVIFIMRDPVERIWSMIHQKSKVLKAQESSIPHSERAFTLSSFTHEAASMRTRYDRTIHELEKVFSTNDIFYDFYERFLNPEPYARLGGFLSIKLNDADFELRRNPSLMKIHIQQELAKEVANHYVDTYNFIYDRFGTQVKELWSGFKYINP